MNGCAMSRAPWLIRATMTLLLATSAGCTSTPPPRASSTSADSADVAALVHERLAAALAGDTARWHRSISDSCVWTGPALHVATTHEVIGSIAANRTIGLQAQQLRELVVHLTGDVAQATYVQLVQDAGQSPETGKRFRKSDTYVRRDGRWLLMGAAEIAVPFRPRRTLGTSEGAALLGRFALAGVDTLTIAAVDGGRFLMRGTDGTADTLLAESDSVLFVEGDPGSWVFPRDRRGAVPRILYRMAGARDIVLPRVP